MVPPDKWSAPFGAKQAMGMMSVTGLDNVGVFSGWVDRYTDRFQFTSSGVYTRGTQTIKFGADWLYNRMAGNSPASPAGRIFFASVDSFLQGRPNQFRGGVLPGVDYDRDIRWNTVG